MIGGDLILSVLEVLGGIVVVVALLGVVLYLMIPNNRKDGNK